VGLGSSAYLVVLEDRPSTRPRNVIDTMHSKTPFMPSTAPGSSSQDDSGTGEHASPDLFESTLSQQTTPQSFDTGINVRTDTLDVEEEMPVADQREEAAPTLSGQTRPATSQPTSRSKRSRLNALEKALSGVTERFSEHQEEAEARVMQAIDDRQKREMELLEKMRKDDRDHELRLVQILGKNDVCPAATTAISVLSAASSTSTNARCTHKHLQFNQ